METMIYQGIAIFLLIAFYTFYIAKLVIQKKQSIKTNQMGMGNKPKKVLAIERIMSVATILVIVAEVASIFLVKHYLPLPVRITGLVLGAIGVLFFAMATVTDDKQEVEKMNIAVFASHGGSDCRYCRREDCVGVKQNGA